MAKNLEQEINQFMNEYENKANTKDFNQLIPLININAVFWFSDGSFFGLEQIRPAFEKTWALLKDEIYKIFEVQWLVMTESSAVCIYKFSSESTFKDKKVTFFGRGTNVLQKLDNKWQVIHEHLSIEPKK